MSNIKTDNLSSRVKKLKIDMVVPSGNEEKFIDMAIKLGYNGLCFLYTPKEFSRFDKDLIQEKKEEYSKILKISSKKVRDLKGHYVANFSIHFGLIASEKELKDIKKFKFKLKPEIIVAKEIEDVRLIVERRLADIIVGVELDNKRDFMHQRNSGINQIICKLAKERDIIFAFDFSEIISSKKPHHYLGRIIQNLVLFQKYKNKIAVASFANDLYLMRGKKDIVSLFTLVGLNALFSKNIFCYAYEKIISKSV